MSQSQTDTVTPTDAQSRISAADRLRFEGRIWVRRARYLLAAALIWAALQFVAGPLVLTGGLAPPPVIMGADYGVLGAVVFLIVLLAAGFAAIFVADPQPIGRPVGAICVGLFCWAATGGVMDNWLSLRNIVPGEAYRSTYVLLLGDYLLLAAVFVVLLAANAAFAGPGDQRQGRIRRFFALDASTSQRRDGIVALVVATAVSAALLQILDGPFGETLRNQVIFAVPVAYILGALAARRITKVQAPIWYLPAPLLVGVLGVLLAAIKPLPSGIYANINNLPVSGLVRPLPIEMISLGMFAVIYTLVVDDKLHHLGDETPQSGEK